MLHRTRETHQGGSNLPTVAKTTAVALDIFMVKPSFPQGGFFRTAVGEEGLVVQNTKDEAVQFSSVQDHDQDQHSSEGALMGETYIRFLRYVSRQIIGLKCLPPRQADGGSVTEASLYLCEVTPAHPICLLKVHISTRYLSGYLLTVVSAIRYWWC